ncbi:DUF6668 family protein [uncultured Pseudokineococcus sp.]|uniref:DUF6668 family protein n=1 Tax=uncultured Pseudokineococcus sp. TaxID=1642928 RepID=UPI002623F496|nr:DUF6668 family protein [uncultured Pseudokineococcus sp.]
MTEDLDQELAWVGAHGGAGTSTLHRAAKVGRDHGRIWPPGSTPVLLVARTHGHGLAAARQALRQHGTAHVRGLVLVADAPGRLPRPLHQQVRVLSGAGPQLWQVPFFDPWRLEPTTAPDRRITDLLSRMTNPQ